MRFRLSGLLAVACSLSACEVVFHIDTAVPDDLATFEPALLGTWVGPDSEAAVITLVERVVNPPNPATDSTYRVEYREKNGDAASFHGRMGRLGDVTVLELWPAFLESDDSWPIGRMLIALTIDGDSFAAAALDHDSVQTAVANGVLQLPYLEYENNGVLTAPTAQLVSALSGYLARPGVLQDGGTWHRVAKE